MGRRRGGTPPASIVRKPSYETYPSEYPSRPNVDIEKALRYLGEPFLYVLELAKLNLDGIAGMRNGGGPILKAPSPFTYWGAAEGALPPRASSASRLCKTYASIDRVPHIQTVYIRRKGSPVSRRAFSVCARTSKTKPLRSSRSRGAGAPSSRRSSPQRGHSPASGNRLRPLNLGDVS